MNLNELDINGLRTEIAILQEDIEKKETYAKFTIPAIMTNNIVSHISSSSGNKNTNGYIINIEDTILLKIPLEYIYFYDGDIIPKGTKFIVVFIGGNINDIKIIGRY